LRKGDAVLIAAFISVFLLAPMVWAFQPPPAQGEFVPISQLPPGDTLPAAPLLVAAYAFVWVVLMVYLWSIWRRLGKVETELQALEHRATPRSRVP
jgi:CcmD family protein